MTSKELREKRANLVSKARAIFNKAKEEKRLPSAEENANFDLYMDEADGLLEPINRAERVERAEDGLAASQGVRAGRPESTDHDPDSDPVDPPTPATDEQRRALESRATSAWLRFGMSSLSPEERAIISSRQRDLSEGQRRALAAGVDTSGGFLVPEGFAGTIITALKQFGGMRRAKTTQFTTQTGQDLPFPTSNDTANMGILVSENQPVGELDIPFGSVWLRAYEYSSQMVRVSLRLIQDSAIDVEPYVAKMLAIRLGRILNKHLTIGDGSAKPRGLFTSAPVAATTALNNAIAWTELLDLKHAVDPDYRANGAEWMLNDSTLKQLKKIEDNNGRPLWVPGIAVREPDTIDGDPYVVNQDAPSIGSATTPLAYGDMSNFYIRDIGGDIMLMRLTERFAEYGQVAFICWTRHDGALIDAGTGPVKTLQMAA